MTLDTITVKDTATAEIEQQPQQDIYRDFLFVSLEAPSDEPEKPGVIDGVAEGEFTDMWGREFTLDAKDFPAYVKNTRRAIEFTRTEKGELVGLPIDARNHDGDAAAGWIVGVGQEKITKPDGKELSILRFEVNWTGLGRDLIESKVRRMFSPTIDIKNKVIVGGSLTNWPASRDKASNILLRPISLSMNALGAGAPGESETSFNPEALPETDAQPEKITDEDATMELSEEMKTYIADAVKGALEGELAAALSSLKPVPPAPDERQPEAGNSLDILKLLELEGVSDEFKTAAKQTLLEQYKVVQEQAKAEAAAMLASIRREANIVELAGKLTGGTAEHPRGIPVEAQELTTWLLSLDRKQAEFAERLLSSIQQNGLVEFAELGHGGKRRGGTETLPAEFAAKLDSGEMTLADLADPILDLGNIEKYDLSKWQEK